jgi:hypothetical protein
LAVLAAGSLLAPALATPGNPLDALRRSAYDVAGIDGP